MRHELATKSTSVGCDQFETSPEAIEQELRTAFCERRQTDRQTDRLKTNDSVDGTMKSRSSVPYNSDKEPGLFILKIVGPYCKTPTMELVGDYILPPCPPHNTIVAK